MSIASNMVLVVSKLTVGIAIHSVGVISEAIHSGMDLAAAVIAYFSVREASKPADDRHRFGHGKIENLSGTVEALLIFVAALWIIYEAIKKLLEGTGVMAVGPGIAVMAVSAVVNLLVSRRLMRVARETDSVALEADAMHLTTDVYTSVGVVAGLIGIRLTGWEWLDPVVAILVAFLIIKAAYRLTLQAFLPLLDVKLPSAEEEAIVAIIESHAQEYIEFHKLRTRKAGAERHIDLHMVVPRHRPVDQVHEFCHHIADDIEERYPNTHVMIHVEPCQDDCRGCHECQGVS